MTATFMGEVTIVNALSVTVRFSIVSVRVTVIVSISKPSFGVGVIVIISLIPALSWLTVKLPFAVGYFSMANGILLAVIFIVTGYSGCVKLLEEKGTVTEELSVLYTSMLSIWDPVGICVVRVTFVSKVAGF